MNQNKVFSIIALSLFTMLYLGIAWYMEKLPLCNYHGDVPTYIGNITDGYVTNWHSSLFIYEGVAIKNVLQVLGVAADGEIAFLCMYYACVALILFCMLHWLHIMMCHHWGYVFVVGGYIYATIILYRGTYGSLDFFFIAMLALYASVMLELRNRKKHRFIAFTLFFLILLHVVAFRKNSILVVPLLLWASCSYFALFPSIKKRLIIVAISSVILYGLSSCLPVSAKVHPAYPMLSSDMKIADILLGKENSQTNPYYTVDSSPPVMSSTIRAHYPEYSGVLWRGYFGDVPGLSEEEYADFISCYKGYWQKNIEAMIYSLALQRIQFFNRGAVPDFVQPFIESKFPKLKLNNQAWSANARLGFVLYLCMLLASLPASVYAASKMFGIFREPSGKVSDDLLLIVLSLSAIVYAASFLIITPVPLMRYLVPSFFILGICSACIVIRWFLCRMQRTAELRR